MILIANLLSALGAILGAILRFFSFVVLASCVISWVNADPYNGIVRTINAITEPLYVQIRRRVRTRFGGLDLTPIVVILAIMFLQHFVAQSLADYASGIRVRALQGGSL